MTTRLHSKTRSLLPPNSTRLERDVEQATARLGALDVRLKTNWHPYQCAANLLPWLAWAHGVEEWDATWPEQIQRDTVANARLIRRTKGTPYAIKLALATLGHPNAQLIERSALKNNAHNIGGAWATFEVKLTRPVSKKQALLIARRLNSAKRNCCHLMAIDFTSNPIKYNKTIRYDGTYSHGVV